MLNEHDRVVSSFFFSIEKNARTTLNFILNGKKKIILNIMFLLFFYSWGAGEFIYEFIYILNLFILIYLMNLDDVGVTPALRRRRERAERQRSFIREQQEATANMRASIGNTEDPEGTLFIFTTFYFTFLFINCI